MRRRNLRLYAVIASIAVLGVGLILITSALSRGPFPVSLSYIGNGTFTNAGVVVSGPTFWLTNHTSKAMLVSLQSVEVLEGTNWTLYGSPTSQSMLAPNANAYATIPFAYQQYPTNSWRIRGVASEQLAGAAAALGAFRYYPRMLWHAYRTGVARIPWNPFTKRQIWYGHHREIISQVVVDAKSIR